MSDWPTHYDHVFRALRGVRRLQGRRGLVEWESWCPGHDDERDKGHRSLSITLSKTGRLLLNCHGRKGCTTKTILQSVNLTMQDAFPDNKTTRPPSDGRQFDRAYDYRDEIGQILMQCVRWRLPNGDKTFTQRRINPKFDPKKPKGKDNQEFLAGIGGVRRVLYRLPELLRALKDRPERWIFVIEGEKAVDYCLPRGITATTNPMGAEKWHPDYSAFLAGCNVVVVPDNDEVDEKKGYAVGHAHAHQVCLSLYGLAASVRLLTLDPYADGTVPDKKGWGLDDWIDAHPAGKSGALTDLRTALGKVAPWAPDLSEIQPWMGELSAEITRVRSSSRIRSADEYYGLVKRTESLLSKELMANGSGKPIPDQRRLAFRLAAVVLFGLEQDWFKEGE